MRQLDNLRVHLNGKAARPAVDLQNALDVCLNTRAREQSAWLELDFICNSIIVDRPVALEHNPVDDRILTHKDNQRGAFDRHADIGKQVGGKQGLDRQVDQPRICNVTGADQHVGQDRVRLDALITFNKNLQDTGWPLLFLNALIVQFRRIGLSRLGMGHR